MTQTLDAMTPDLIAKYAAPLPRYTSYPTANHFGPNVSAGDYGRWIAELPECAALSLYLHIPFCQELCWYCGCSTKAIRRYEPVTDYMQPLTAEVALIAARVPKRHRVTHIHWGGGSPDILKPDDIRRLGAELSARFAIAADAELAVEVDPRLLTDEQAQAFADIGINRVSIGVQDFDEAVQRAIGRMQGYDTTARAVEYFRRRDIRSVNVDLVYGLPHQTEESTARTLEKVLTLGPDRIAIFGYAHLPERLKHQRLIDEKALPGAVERYRQSRRLSRMLMDAGYMQLGLDHFALPADTLVTKALARNFQGYTTDSADALLGLGASSISKLPQGFAQNSVPVDDYARRISEGQLATTRGHKLSADDAMRAYVIEQLMCGFAFSWRDLEARFGTPTDDIRRDAERLANNDEDDLVQNASETFSLTERGKVLVRNVCAGFDAYLTEDVARRRHALSV